MSAAELPDPGRRWRRCVRVGAVLCTLATVVPFDGTDLDWCVWARLPSIVRDLGLEGPSWLGLYCSFIFTVILGGPVLLLLLLLCAAADYDSTALRRNLTRILLGGLWAVSTLPPYYAAIRIFQKVGLSEVQVALIASGLSVFLLITALGFLTSRRVWYTPLYPFAMGVVPVTLGFLAWTGAMFDIVNEIKGRIGTYQQLSLVFGSGAVGSALILLGWLMWWSAVRRAMRANPALGENR